MTRDEAITKVQVGYEPEKLVGAPTIIVDALVTLGLLKLDEPKSVQDRAVDAIRAHKELYDVRPICVFDALDYAGLKIVEKQI